MTDLRNCETCYAFRICPQKPKRENYTDENKYLIDLECGVWDCKTTVENLWKRLYKAKDLLTKAIRNTWSIDFNVVNEINEFLKECE